MKIINPTEEPLLVSLFITTKEVYNHIEEGINDSVSKPRSVFDTTEMGDKDYFYKLFCGPKLLESSINDV